MRNALLIGLGLIVGGVALASPSRKRGLSFGDRPPIKFSIPDPISRQRVRGLHPVVKAKAHEFLARAYQQGIYLRITEGFRTFERQDELYDQGRRTPGNIVTYAQGGESFHNYGLAIDVVEIKNGKALWSNPNWPKIGSLGKGLGFEWGGDWQNFKDWGHFQMTFGFSTEDLKSKWLSFSSDLNYLSE